MEFARKQVRTFGAKPVLNSTSMQSINRGLDKDFVATTHFTIDIGKRLLLSESHHVVTRRSSALFRGRGWHDA